ncbi:MAG: sulfur oxidation c-type cytochrome SoxA, partial [Pseudomonadota bacterium]
MFVIAACGEKAPIRDSFSDLKPEDIRSGYTFLQPETQSLQDDDFSNPGLLWVDRGQELFHAGD